MYHYEDGSTEVETVQVGSGASTDDGSSAGARRASLATLLTEAGLASDEQIHQALEEGKRTGEKLGEVVLRRGWATEGRLAQLLAEQWGLNAVDPGALSLDPLAVSRLEAGVAAELGGFPVWFDEHGTVVAVAEPSEQRFSAFRERLGNVTFVVVPRSTLNELAESRLFGAKGRDTDHTPNGAAGASNTNGGPDVHLDEQQMEEHPGESPIDLFGDTSPPDQTAPAEDASASSPAAPGSLVERLRSIEVEVQALEQALGESRRAVEAHDAELAALRDTRTQDLDRIRELEAELAARNDRFRAFRDKVADLSHAFDD